MNEQTLLDRIREVTGIRKEGPLTMVRDTTDFMRINPGDLLQLDGRYYYVRGEAVEGRFGLDGEPKFWVKRALDLEDGSMKYIKLVFHESFTMNLGVQAIKCYRSPDKESRILDLSRGDPRFMQGFTVADEAGNSVRVIDKVEGARFYDFIHDRQEDHETYFRETFPSVLRSVMECVEAIEKLHQGGEIHGDIRNDHIIINPRLGRYVWIDFDYAYDWSENPYGVDLFGLGNVLLFAAGKGFHTLPDVCGNTTGCYLYGATLNHDDCSLFFPHRIMALGKLFPYVPESLDYVLLHFANGAEIYYETTAELIADLRVVAKDIGAE